MKKFINLILVTLIALTVVIPDYASAASPYPIRYWKRFQKELHDYLINYRAPLGSGNTCIRTAQLPDGTSDCLSMGKISRIMAQLDTDDYWAKTDPTKRREYLWNTTRQPYVMKKVVMYFEQNLNLETRIYGADLPREKVNMYVNDTLAEFSKSVIALGKLTGKILNIYVRGDNDIRTLAFDSMNVGEPFYPVYEYILKPKSEITYSDLEKIYQTDRMKPFQTWIDYPDWRQDELNAMAPAVAKDMNAIDEAHKYGTSPVYAKIKQDSMQIALMAAGGGGIETKVGGMTLARGAIVPEAMEMTIGARSIQFDGVRLQQVFNASKLGTNHSVRTQALGKIEEAAQMLVNSQKKRLPDIDTLLADLVANRTYIAPSSYIGKLNGFAGAGGAYMGETRTVLYADELFGNPNIKEPYAHELIHGLRHEVEMRQGITENLGRGIDEASCSWTAVQTLGENEVRVVGESHVDTSGYFSRRFINDVTNVIAKKQGTALVQAQDWYLRLEFGGRYSAVDDILDRPGFMYDLSGKLYLYDLAAKAAVKEHSATGLQYALRDAKDIRDFIYQGSGILP